MKKTIQFMITTLIILSLVGCSKSDYDNDLNSELVLKKSYEQVQNDAKDSTVYFYGYGGNEVMNKWFDTYVVETMKKNYNINVKRIGMNIDDIMNKLVTEKLMNDSIGTIDVVWLNGENFKASKNSEILFGPFTKKLPNYNKYIDENSKEVTIDFGTSVDNMEAPWGKSQFAILYDLSKTKQDIKNHKDLLKVIKKYPGKFTYPAPPDFTGSAFVRNIIYDIVGYEKLVNLENDKEKIKKVIKPAIDYLNEIKPYLWQKGKTYPSTEAQLDNMYADGEVYFSMTYSPNIIPGRIKNGEIPKETKIVEFENGNISNTHFLAIPNNAQNKEGAMVLIDFLLSVESQASKTDSKNWGDTSVLDLDKVEERYKNDFKETINIEKSLPELDSDLLITIEEIWTEEVLEGE